MKNNIFILYPRYDARKSFYNKALVIESEKNYILLSYDSVVCRISKNTKKITLNKSIDDELLYSLTTCRHIKEFIKQFSDAEYNTLKELKTIKRAIL